MKSDSLGQQSASPQTPSPVVDVTFPTNPSSYSQTATFVTGAASLTGRIQLPAPILSVGGGKVASHWRRNKVWTAKTQSVTETNGAAAFTVYDSANVLSNLFATASGTKMFVARLTIDGGSEIFGYITSVSVSSSVYTFTVVSQPAGSTQNWAIPNNGSLPGSTRGIRDVEIYANQNSLVFTTGTVLTEEVPFDYPVSEEDVIKLLNSLLAGQWAQDNVRGRLFYKKATTGTSDTVTYNTYTGSGGLDANVNVDKVGGTTVAAANTAKTTATPVLPTQNVDASGNITPGGTAANTARTTATLVLPTQIIDAAGNVVSVSAANTARTTSTLVLPVQMVDASGNVTDTLATVATLTNVNDSNVSATLLAANAARKGVVIFNDSTVALYIKYGATASATSFTYKIAAGATWEMKPATFWQGIIDGIWDSDQSGAARITEMT